MKFIAIKTEGGRKKGKIAFYCRILKISRQGFHKYLNNRDKPWKYQPLANAMLEIIREDECNDTYGRSRMHQALKLKEPDGVEIPSERTVYRVMEKLGISHTPKRKTNGGYICVASSDYSKGTVVETSLGTGKVYDCGCASGTIDIYTNW